MAVLRFKPIDHPSDVGIIACGKTREEIFENAAYGMFASMANLDKVSPKQKFDIKVTGEDAENLLVNWLNELLFHEDAKKVLFKEFKIRKMTDTSLEAEVWGERINLNVHEMRRPVKAATYNQLHIDKNQAKIIFDV